MSDGSILQPFLIRLARKFDQGIRALPEEQSLKGWGQFIAAEHHSRQVGLYGTCAGVIVKTIANKDATLDEGIILYLRQQWQQRNQSSQRDFNQNIRISFLVIALAYVQDRRLITLRNQAVAELLRRQKGDGSWGDWWLENGDGAIAPSRLETTAFAILALARLKLDQIRHNILRGARFLQAEILAYSQIETDVDPFLVGVLLHCLPKDEIAGRIQTASDRFLSILRPTNDLSIYFFDYFLDDSEYKDVKRDYLCVPRFFSFSLLSSSPGHDGFSLRAIRTALAHWRCGKFLSASLSKDPITIPGSRYPASVDQAFLALSAEYTDTKETRFGKLFGFIAPVYGYASKNSLVRVAIPIIILGIIGAISEDPGNIIGLYKWFGGLEESDLAKFVITNASVIQISSIALCFLIGHPLLQSIWQYLREKWA